MSLLLDRYAEILERLRAELVAHYGPRLVSVAVYGSVGRGTPRQDSDIDVLIVARDLPRGRTARVEEFLPVEARVESWLSTASSSVGPLMLSPVFKTPAEVEAGSPLFLEDAHSDVVRYSHKWRVGDLVMWDNRATMHRARRYDDEPYPRDLRRTTLTDGVPTVEQEAAPAAGF